MTRKLFALSALALTLAAAAQEPRYRGLVYESPDFGLSALHTDKITHTAQPSAGIVSRF